MSARGEEGECNGSPQKASQSGGVEIRGIKTRIQIKCGVVTGTLLHAAVSIDLRKCLRAITSRRTAGG